jgi:oxygen-independent coproporphyrinogen-3 oxidase
VSFSLYAHIPYCQSKCPYCDFNSYGVSQWPEAEYVSAIVTEMSTRATTAPWAGQRIKTMFFGGGTPSLFMPASIDWMIQAADRLFGLAGDCEVTLEANPGTIDQPKLCGYKAAGVNRLSFGVQSFNPTILKFLGRIHDAEQARQAVIMAQRAGFERLNLDLIFAVPGQRVEDVYHDISAATSLGSDHISAYNLTFEEKTVFFAEMKRGRIRPLSEDEQAAMFELVRTELPRRGYPMYEISNYAPGGHEARHNLTYWKAESYLGVGAGAHSCALDDQFSQGVRWWNEALPSRYLAAVRKRGTAENGCELIQKRQLQQEFVFLNLRLRAGFELIEFERRFGETFENRFGDVAAPLLQAGLLVRDQDRLFLSDRGLEISDSVFAQFM